MATTDRKSAAIEVHVAVCEGCALAEEPVPMVTVSGRPILADRLRAGLSLSRAHGYLPAPVHVATVACLRACQSGPAVALWADGMPAFLFGPIRQAADIDAVVAFVQRYSMDPNGEIETGLWRPVLRPKHMPHLARLLAGAAVDAQDDVV